LQSGVALKPLAAGILFLTPGLDLTPKPRVAAKRTILLADQGSGLA
jgi:hypothetical protein